MLGDFRIRHWQVLFADAPLRVVEMIVHWLFVKWMIVLSDDESGCEEAWYSGQQGLVRFWMIPDGSTMILLLTRS